MTHPSQIARLMAVKWGPPLGRFAGALLRRPIFLVGFNKSGKSLLVHGLVSGREFCVFPGEGNETLWFRDFYPRWDPDLVASPLWYDPDSFVQAVVASRTDGFRSSRAQLGLFQALRCPGRPLLNDSGMLAAILPHVIPAFPDARIVHVVRDGRVVSVLAARKTLSRIEDQPERYRGLSYPADFRGVLRAQAEYWCWTLDRLRIVEELAPRKVMVVRYEDWCEDPESTVAAILGFAGVARRGRKLAWPSPVRNRNEETLASVPTEDLEFLQAVQERHLRRMGYWC